MILIGFERFDVVFAFTFSVFTADISSFIFIFAEINV